VSLNCPRCQTGLNPGLPHTALCPDCHGLWVDRGALTDLVRQDLEVLEASPLAPTLHDDHLQISRAPLLNCPVCSNPLIRHIYCADSGIEVDRCRDHGVWLDDGELAQAIDFIRLEIPEEH